MKRKITVEIEIEEKVFENIVEYQKYNEVTFSEVISEMVETHQWNKED